MIIALDGPAASGKGTIARRLAERFRLAHLDTGLLYRSVARAMLDRQHGGAAPAGGDRERQAAAALARRIALPPTDDPRLRAAEVDALSARIATWPEVRDGILAVQRRFAHAPPGGARGAVLDGRDIASVVCPEADIKVFVTASEEARARRRLAERRARGVAADLAAVRAELRRRDASDRNRHVAPLRQTRDAVLLDTTDLAIESAVDRVAALIGSRLSDVVG